MNFSSSQKAAALEHSDRLLQGTIRGALLQGEKRERAVDVIMDAIGDEFGLFAPNSVATEAAPMRNMMVCSIRKRMRQNPKCESVLLLLILGAIFTWLIHRLLDWIFLNEQYPE
jgi:hypothetical protein